MSIGKACFDTDNGKTDRNGNACKERVLEYDGSDFVLTNRKCDDDFLRTSEFDAGRMCCGCGGGASKDIL